MRVKEKLRLYVSNIISFANSKTRNSLRDRSSEFFYDDVTPELNELMRTVWKPIVGPYYDIYVIRVRKTSRVKSLGISLEGSTTQLQLTNQQQLQPIYPNNNGSCVDGNRAFDANTEAVAATAVTPTTTIDPDAVITDFESRHFVQQIAPDGLIGSLGVVHPGDEILQVNGRRLRGCSHSNVIRYLRHLPSRIQLVLARAQFPNPTDLVDHFQTDLMKLKQSVLEITDNPSPLEIQASDVGSVDTNISEGPNSPIIYNQKCGFRSSQSDRCNRHTQQQLQTHSLVPYSNPTSPNTTHKRVTEWMTCNNTVGAVNRADYDSSPSQLYTTADQMQNQVSSDYYHSNFDADQFSSKWENQCNPQTSMRKYSSYTTSLSTALNDVIIPEHSLRRVQTLPRQFYRGACNRIDPRYGDKRPKWNKIPLVIELNKTSKGFGFSISQYEELAVVDLTDESTAKRSYTLGRCASTRTKSEQSSLQFSPKSVKLKRNSSFSATTSRQKQQQQSKRNMILIDSIIPGSVAQLDGRISVGDRLLFVNDRSLMNSTMKVAARTLQSIPVGPCLIGLAKLQLEPNVRDGGDEINRSDTGFDCIDNTGIYSLPRNCTFNTNDSAVLDNFNVTSTDDMQIDFDFVPLLCPNPELHSPRLCHIPPLDWNLEQTVKIKLDGRKSIGVKLDALPCQGQDGCRILQLTHDGVLAHNKTLHANDYITKLNGVTMRHLDNLQAFQILHGLSQDKACCMLEVGYFPAALVESHRFAFLSELTKQVQDGVETVTTHPFVHMVYWSPPVEIILHRNNVKQDWGLIVNGPLYGASLPYLSRLNVSNPSLICDIRSGSAADQSKLIQPGLLLLQVHDVDVLNFGPSKVNQLLTDLSASDETELHLVVSQFDAVDDGGGGLDAMIVQQQTPDQPSAELGFRADIYVKHRKQSSSAVNGFSQSSSEMENPEPLTGTESNNNTTQYVSAVEFDSVGINDNCTNDSQLQRESQPNTAMITNNNNNNNSGEENGFTGGAHHFSNLCSPYSPVINDDDEEEDIVAAGAVVVNMETRNSIDDNNCFSDASVHLTPPPRLPPKPVVKSDSSDSLICGVDVGSQDPVKLYTRPLVRGDEIITVHLTLPTTMWSRDNGNKLHLGIRLVGSHVPELVASYIAGFSPNSITHPDLRSGDEIVQIESLNVCGMHHLKVQQFINRIIREKLLKSQQKQTDPNCRLITLIVRRNPINMNYMACSSCLPTNVNLHHQPLSQPHLQSREQQQQQQQQQIVPTSGNNPNSITSSGDVQRATTSTGTFLPIGLNSITDTFLKQVMLELKGDVDKFQLFDVTLKRGPDGFGIFIVNCGPNSENGVFVSDVKEDSPASQQGILKSNDRILAVDGKLESGYDTTFQLLQKSEIVCLTIGRVITNKSHTTVPNNTDETDSHCDRTMKNSSNTLIPGVPALVTLFRESIGLGFSIVGGSDTVLNNILIHEVHKGGAADRDGRLQSGDRLLAVNGIDLRDATQEQATKNINSVKDCVQLLVCRGPRPQRFVQKMVVFQNVILKRTCPDQNLGVSLCSRPNYATGTMVLQIFPNTPAAMCNNLRVGDIILEVNGVDVRLSKSDEVIDLLLKVDSKEVKLLVGRYKTAQNTQAYHTNSLLINTVVLNVTSQKPDEDSANQVSAKSNATSLQICDISLIFGFGVRVACEPEFYNSVSYFIIDNIQPGGVADSSHMMLPGDRLMTINGEPIDWLSATEIVSFLSTLRYCTLELGRVPNYHNNNAKHIRHRPQISTPSKQLPNPMESYTDTDVMSKITTLNCITDLNDLYQLYPPFPAPSEELPALFDGFMPDIESPKCVHEMSILTEQEEDEDLTTPPLPLPVNMSLPVVDSTTVTGLTTTTADVYTPPVVCDGPLTQIEIKTAVDIAERTSGAGFQLRQIQLPPAIATYLHPNVLSTNDDETNQQMKLGLCLIEGSGVSGPIVGRISPNSAAAQTEIQIGDRIIGLNDRLLLLLNDKNQSLSDDQASAISSRIEQIWLSNRKQPCYLTIITTNRPNTADQQNKALISDRLVNGLSKQNGHASPTHSQHNHTTNGDISSNSSGGDGGGVKLNHNHAYDDDDDDGNNASLMDHEIPPIENKVVISNPKLTDLANRVE